MGQSYHFWAGFSRKLPMQWVLLIAFIIPLMGAVFSVGYISYKNEQHVVQDFTRQLVSRTSDRIQHQLAHYLDNARVINQMNAEAIAMGDLSLTNPDQLIRAFWQKRSLFDRVCGSAIYVGTPAGEFVSLGLNQAADWRIGRAGKDTDGRYYSYSVRQGNVDRLQERRGLFDPRRRPWYQAAQQAKHAVWSPVYPSFRQQSAQITLTQPIYTTDGALQGILGVDCSLSSLGDYLGQLKVGQGGSIFIVERSGALIATATSALPVNPPQTRTAAIASDDPLVQETATELQQRFGTQITLDRPQEFSIDQSGDPYWVRVTPLKNAQGLDWLIVVVTPLSDLMAQVDANTRLTFFLSLIPLAGAIVLSLFLTRRLTQIGRAHV